MAGFGDSAPFGIKAAYPRLPFSAKAKAYIGTARPLTLTAPILGVIAAVGMASEYGYSPLSESAHAWRVLVYGAATLVMVTIGSNFVNQASDALEDSITKQWRAVPRGIVTRDEAHTLGVLLWLIAILRAATINASFGILVMLIVTTSFLYSLPPVRLKGRLWLGNAGVALARGLLGLPAAWTLIAPVQSPQPWVAGGILFLYLLGATTAKDFHDAIGDAQAGVRNLVTVYGSKWSRIASLPFILTPIITLPVALRLGWLHYPSWSLLVTMVIVAVFAHRFLFESATPNRYLEGTKAWAWTYFSLCVILLNFGIQGFI